MPVTQTPSGDIYYEVCDLTPPWVEKPQTIIFHHGVAAQIGIWTPWLGVLASKYRLVRFDMRGFGRSAVPAADFAWTFDALVDDLNHVANEVGVERFHLVGESIGGTTAIAFALSHPKRLLSLALSNTSAKGGLLGNVNVWREMIKTGGQKKWASQMMDWRFHKDGLTPEVFHWYLELHQHCSIDACLGLADLLLSVDFSKKLSNIQMPTLLLSPDDSPFIPASIMTSMRDEIAGAEIEVFAHSKHGLPLSHGEACARVLLNFLERRT